MHVIENILLGQHGSVTEKNNGTHCQVSSWEVIVYAPAELYLPMGSAKCLFNNSFTKNCEGIVTDVIDAGSLPLDFYQKH